MPRRETDGVISAKKGPSHLRSMRQHVKVTAFDLEAFHNDTMCLDMIWERINYLLGGDGILPMDYVPHEGLHSLDTHARYFTDRAQVPYEKDTPFSRLVDPHGILGEIKPDYFIHGADNWVEYCKETTEGKHEPIDPSSIKNGDLVEVAFACVAVPTKEGKHKLLLNLKAVTLIDDSIRKEAEQKRANAKKATELHANGGIKRRRIYVDMDDPRRTTSATDESYPRTDLLDSRRPAKQYKPTVSDEEAIESGREGGGGRANVGSYVVADHNGLSEETERMQED